MLCIKLTYGTERTEGKDYRADSLRGRPALEMKRVPRESTVEIKETRVINTRKVNKNSLVSYSHPTVL